MDLGIKILILDDRMSDAELILHELKKPGVGFAHEIVQTRDAYEKALDAFKPDIILSDYSMPSFDGITAFNIKQKKCPDVPFIILSNAIGEENAVEMIRNGVTDYVLKNKLFTLNTKVARALRELNERLGRKLAEEEMQKKYAQLVTTTNFQLHHLAKSLETLVRLLEQIKSDHSEKPELLNETKKLVEESVEQIRKMSLTDQL